MISCGFETFSSSEAVDPKSQINIHIRQPRPGTRLHTVTVSRNQRGSIDAMAKRTSLISRFFPMHCLGPYSRARRLGSPGTYPSPLSIIPVRMQDDLQWISHRIQKPPASASTVMRIGIPEKPFTAVRFHRRRCILGGL